MQWTWQQSSMLFWIAEKGEICIRHFLQLKSVLPNHEEQNGHADFKLLSFLCSLAVTLSCG